MKNYSTIKLQLNYFSRKSIAFSILPNTPLSQFAELWKFIDLLERKNFRQVNLSVDRFGLPAFEGTFRSVKHRHHFDSVLKVEACFPRTEKLFNFPHNVCI